MTIQDLGSIGEMVGAIATVATLLYLALQIRASNLIARSESHQKGIGSAIPSNLAIAESPALAELLLDGLRSYPDLPRADATRFAFLMSSVLAPHMSVLHDHELGLASAEDIAHVKATIGRLLTMPGGANWLEEYSSDLPVYYVQFAKQTLAEEYRPQSKGDLRN